MYKHLVVLLTIYFLAGCAQNPTAIIGGEMANKSLQKDKSPLRVEVNVLEGGGAVITEVWAGKKGVSIMESADETLKRDVWTLFEKKCGFHQSDLREVKVVEHKHPYYYEVWVFNDVQSRREDNTSGISLILSIPSTGGVDIELIGSCGA